jgi:predicted hydrolase (HD superfamily)
VNRGEIEHGAVELGVELWAHVENVILAMRTIAGDLGLDGQAAR